MKDAVRTPHFSCCHILLSQKYSHCFSTRHFASLNGTSQCVDSLDHLAPHLFRLHRITFTAHHIAHSTLSTTSRLLISRRCWKLDSAIESPHTRLPWRASRPTRLSQQEWVLSDADHSKPSLQVRVHCHVTSLYIALSLGNLILKMSTSQHLIPASCYITSHLVLAIHKVVWNQCLTCRFGSVAKCANA